MKYYPVIGLEIHVELKTKSKMFCQCAADYFGKEPNTNTCPVCLGMPGALPVPNRQAIEWTIKIGQALNCTINKKSKFDRKHYYYPDLPKGYQISQYDEPIAVNGKLEMRNEKLGIAKKFGITRVHLEEDTGKLTHAGEDTLVDFNRSSVPLVEIVTEPDFENSEDVKSFLEELHTIIRTLDVSDADMEKGSMRMEPNISLSVKGPMDLRIKGSNRDLPKYKVEVKNINSFNFAKKAIDYELTRQAEILDKGEIPPQETRGYNENKGITYSQRSKEEAQDYRYFPEPDIPPMEFTVDELETIRRTITELPAAKLDRFMTDYKIKYEDAFILTRDAKLSKYFEEVVHAVKEQSNSTMPESITSNLPQAIANAIINKKIATDVSPDACAQVFIEANKPVETDTAALDTAIDAVFSRSEAQIAQYKAGKTTVIGFFIGQVMREMKGKADPGAVKERIEEKLK